MASKHTAQRVVDLLGAVPYIEDAPHDDKIYARSKGGWVDVSNDFELAPQVISSPFEVINPPLNEEFYVTVHGFNLSEIIVVTESQLGGDTSLVFTYHDWDSLMGGTLGVTINTALSYGDITEFTNIPILKSGDDIFASISLTKTA